MSLDLEGEPIVITLFPGGMDSSTFMRRRKVTIHTYLELESLEAYSESEDMAAKFGELLGRALHAQLQVPEEEQAIR